MIPQIDPTLVKAKISLAKLRSAKSNIVLVPLYAETGDPGYFVCRENYTCGYYEYYDIMNFVPFSTQNSYDTAIGMFKFECSQVE